MTHGGHELGEALMHASRALRRRMRASLEEWGLSPHQARALRTVCGENGARLSDVAARLRIAPRSATEVVDSLEAGGFVTRQPDPTDRRAVLVVATEEGRRVHAATDRLHNEAATEFFGRLDETEQEQLGRLLRRLAD